MSAFLWFSFHLIYIFGGFPYYGCRHRSENKRNADPIKCLLFSIIFRVVCQYILELFFFFFFLKNRRDCCSALQRWLSPIVYSFFSFLFLKTGTLPWLYNTFVYVILFIFVLLFFFFFFKSPLVFLWFLLDNNQLGNFPPPQKKKKKKNSKQINLPFYPRYIKASVILYIKRIIIYSSGNFLAAVPLRIYSLHTHLSTH